DGIRDKLVTGVQTCALPISFQRAFFPSRNAHADKMDSCVLQVFATPLRVSEKRISAVDNDVAFFQQRRDLLDHSVNRRARLYHRSEEHTSELQSLAYLVCRL